MSSARSTLAVLLGALVLFPGDVLAQDEPAKKDEKESGEIAFEEFSKAAENLVEAMFRASRNVKSYADQGVMSFETGTAWKQPEQKIAFTYVKPNRFTLTTEMHHLVSDGKELTVHMKQTDRYKTEPLREDVGKQVAQYLGEFGFTLGSADLVLNENPRRKFAEMFKRLDVGERETIDGDKCVTLHGNFGTPFFQAKDVVTPVTLYLREQDRLLRRVVIDFSEAMKKQAEENPGMVVTEYKIIYDVRDIKVNEPVDGDTFKFKAPATAKKVEKFFNRWGVGGSGAEQFELSGKPAPDFELATSGGDPVHLEALRGKVVVLNFVLSAWGGSNDVNSRGLHELKASLGGDVEILTVTDEETADKILERYREAQIDLPVVLDPDRDAFDEYFEQMHDAGVVLIGRDGTVQGRYRALFNKDQTEGLKKDLEKLVAGESLPGGKAMTDDELEEYRDQTAVSYSGGKRAEAVSAEDLSESWSIRLRANNSYTMGGSSLENADELWVRDGKYLRHITTEGEIVGEILLPSKGGELYAQETVIVGRIGRRFGAVLMTTIPGEEQQPAGWRPPKGVVLTAVSENGDEIWRQEMEVENHNVPQSLSLADLDGRGGDELVFFKDGAIWILDEHGEVICRKNVNGWAQSIDARDRDRDKKAELYIRTQDKLIRYDYKSRK